MEYKPSAMNETTQASWNLRMDENPSLFKGDRRPVEQVTWKQCMAFCQSLNQAQNFKAILKGMIFGCLAKPNGNLPLGRVLEAFISSDKPDLITDYAWISENSSPDSTCQKQESQLWGFHDLTETPANGAWTAMENALKKTGRSLLGMNNLDKVNRGEAGIL